MPPEGYPMLLKASARAYPIIEDKPRVEHERLHIKTYVLRVMDVRYLRKLNKEELFLDELFDFTHMKTREGFAFSAREIARMGRVHNLNPWRIASIINA